MLSKTVIIGIVIWFIAALFYALDYFQHSSPAVLLLPIATSMHIDVRTVAGIMAIYWPFYALAQIPAGWLLDRYGAKWVLSIACMIMSIGILMFTWQPIVLTMWLARVIVAIGSAFAFLGTLKVASDVLPKSIFPIAVGITNTVGSISGIFGQVLLSHGIVHLGWQGALQFVGYVGIIYSFVLYIFMPAKQAASTPSSVSRKLSIQYLHVLKSKHLWFVALYAGIMVGTVLYAFSELYDVVFLQYTYSLTAVKAASISSTIFVGIAVGGPSHGIIVRLLGDKKRWMLMANVATIIVFSTIVLTPANQLNITFLYLLYFLLGFFVSSMLLAFAVVNDIFATEVQGTVLAFTNMIISIGGVFFQNLVAYVTTWINGGDIKVIHNPHVFVLSFVFLLCFLVLSFFLLLLIDTRDRVSI